MHRKKEDPTLKNEQGFTLIEVVMAMGVFAICFLGLAALQTSYTKNATSARKITDETLIVAQTLEQLMATPYIDIVDGQNTIDGYTVTWTVAANDGTGALPDETLTVDITAVNPSTNKQVNMRQIIPNLTN